VNDFVASQKIHTTVGRQGVTSKKVNVQPTDRTIKPIAGSIVPFVFITF